MAKGKLKNPHWVNTQCQYCDKEFRYYRETSSIRKACFDCIPEGKGKDVALIRRLIKNKAIMSKGSRCYRMIHSGDLVLENIGNDVE